MRRTRSQPWQVYGLCCSILGTVRHRVIFRTRRTLHCLATVAEFLNFLNTKSLLGFKPSTVIAS